MSEDSDEDENKFKQHHCLLLYPQAAKNRITNIFIGRMEMFDTLKYIFYSPSRKQYIM